ncbi:MAG: thioredoxin domain-containing protein [Candidatus Peribacteraceae bacterium]|jgi:protein-disulfide isomerase|nr:thioredoxin domain-containing protein [Candidatus Peribacteraceae bacterium]MDP7454544.1 thioredoxin domain-containing protein [Candidatus Peribacteraceae bacterium]
MNFRFLTLALTLTLFACIQVPERATPVEKIKDPPPMQPEERVEEIAPVDIQELIAGTGALAERLLATGVIDIGRRDAPVTLLLFTEHHAKYARDFQLDLFPRLYSDFIEEGMLKFQIAILPLKKYPGSQNAATGLICSAMQSKGMAMHQILSDKLDAERLEPEHYATELGLDMEKFNECMTSEEIGIILKQQKAWSKGLDVTLVPTYFINGEKFIGLPYYADLNGAIEEKLK